MRLYPVGGGGASPRGATERCRAAWTDGRGPRVDREGLPARIFVLDLTTGRKTLWRRSRPPTRPASRESATFIRPDGRATPTASSALSELQFGRRTRRRGLDSIERDLSRK